MLFEGAAPDAGWKNENQVTNCIFDQSIDVLPAICLPVWLLETKTRQYKDPRLRAGRRKTQIVKKGNVTPPRNSSEIQNLWHCSWNSVIQYQYIHYSFLFQPESYPGRRSLLGNVIWKGDEKCSRAKLLQAVPENRVQRGEHDVLARLRGPQKGDEQDCGGGESPSNLWGLHLDPLP